MKLRRLEMKDVDGMFEWMRDPKINKFFRFSEEMIERENAERFISSTISQWDLGENKHYAIASDMDEYLGTVSLKNIDKESQNAEYAISLREGVQGRGVARFGTLTVLKKAFVELELERVYLNVLEDNIRAIRLYEACGFHYEGEFRKHIKIAGEFKSLRWYGILKEDFEAKEVENECF